jgi:hypothetical protein
MWGDWQDTCEVMWCGGTDRTHVKWCDVGGLTGYMWSDFVLKWSEVKSVTAKFLQTKVTCILGWLYTEGTWLHCDYFIWCVSCTVAVLTCFVTCACVYVCVCVCVFCNVCVFWQYVKLYLLCFCIVSFMYIYSYLLLVYGLLPPGENSTAVNNNNNNNNRCCTGISTPEFSTFSDVTILAKQAVNQFKSNVSNTGHSMKLI